MGHTMAPRNRCKPARNECMLATQLLCRCQSSEECARAQAAVALQKKRPVSQRQMLPCVVCLCRATTMHSIAYCVVSVPLSHSALCTVPGKASSSPALACQNQVKSEGVLKGLFLWMFECSMMSSTICRRTSWPELFAFSRMLSRSSRPTTIFTSGMLKSKSAT